MKLEGSGVTVYTVPLSGVKSYTILFHRESRWTQAIVSGVTSVSERGCVSYDPSGT